MKILTSTVLRLVATHLTKASPSTAPQVYSCVDREELCHWDADLKALVNRFLGFVGEGLDVVGWAGGRGVRVRQPARSIYEPPNFEPAQAPWSSPAFGPVINGIGPHGAPTVQKARHPRLC